MTAPAVYELDTRTGSRLLYAEGSPEAEAFHVEYGDPANPVELLPATEPDPPYVDDSPPESPDDIEEPMPDVPVEDPASEVPSGIEATGD